MKGLMRFRKIEGAERERGREGELGGKGRKGRGKTTFPESHDPFTTCEECIKTCKRPTLPSLSTVSD